MSEEEKNSIVQEVLNRIQSNSQAVDELETVDSLGGVVSLPAQHGYRLVRVPVSLLSKPAEDAAKTANDAAGKATESASKADAATGKADLAAKDANKAAAGANTAAGRANDIASAINGRIVKLEERDEILSESEYEALAVKDKDKLYFIYEDE